ncbi:MAG: hypothetical protein QOJ44_1701, partial [Acidimicrobiaceae bacterium]|nr:hypothetical protein [Acidimicrobiaceae bacterium]
MRKGVLAATTLLAIVVSCVWPVAAGATGRVQIRTLSNRADLISGGETLVQIV